MPMALFAQELVRRARIFWKEWTKQLQVAWSCLVLYWGKGPADSMLGSLLIHDWILLLPGGAPQFVLWTLNQPTNLSISWTMIYIYMLIDVETYMHMCKFKYTIVITYLILWSRLSPWTFSMALAEPISSDSSSKCSEASRNEAFSNSNYPAGWIWLILLIHTVCVHINIHIYIYIYLRVWSLSIDR